MKKIYFFFLIGFFLVVMNSPIQASGTPSELLMKQDGQTLYISTQQTSSSSTEVNTTSTSSSVVGQNITPPTGFAKDVGSLINFALQAIIVIAVLLVFAFLIMGGVQWITSGGEKTKTEAARNKIVAAILGLIVVAASYAIMLLILRFLGFTDLNDAINSLGTIDGSPTPTATSSSQLREQNLVE